MKTLNEHIKNKTFSRIYLLYGEEKYLIRFYRDKLTESILGEKPSGNMNYHHYEGVSAIPADIAEQGLCMPFFAERQLLVIENSGLFKSANDLPDIIPDMPESTYIIFIEDSIDKRNSLYKYVKANGVISEINHMNDYELVSWIASYLSKADCMITKRAANLLIFKAGTDMSTLASELEKLISYVGDSKKIDNAEVDAICITQLTGKIFLMMDHIVSGNRTKALNLYRDLVVLKENISNIIFLLTRHYNILLCIKDIYHESDNEIARKLSVPSFTVRKYKTQASAYTKKEITDRISMCIETEEAIKTGRAAPQIATEVLIVSLSTKQ